MRDAVIAAYKDRRDIARKLHVEHDDMVRKGKPQYDHQLQWQRALGAVYALGALLGLNEFIVYQDVICPQADYEALPPEVSTSEPA